MEDFIFIFPNQVKIINEIRTSQIRREDQVDDLIPETVANISGKLKNILLMINSLKLKNKNDLKNLWKYT